MKIQQSSLFFPNLPYYVFPADALFLVLRLFYFFCISLFFFSPSKSRNYIYLFISVPPQRAGCRSFRGDPRSVLVRFRKQLAAARGRSYFSVSRYQRSLITTNTFSRWRRRSLVLQTLLQSIFFPNYRCCRYFASHKKKFSEQELLRSYLTSVYV